jgi:hypothetical protein
VLNVLAYSTNFLFVGRLVYVCICVQTRCRQTGIGIGEERYCSQLGDGDIGTTVGRGETASGYGHGTSATVADSTGTGEGCGQKNLVTVAIGIRFVCATLTVVTVGI